MINIIFDCDGVIVDTEGTKLSAWQNALSEVGINLTREEYVRSFAGNSGKASVAYLNSSRNISLPESIVDRKNDILKHLMLGELLVMPNAPETARELYDFGFPLSVASSDGQEETMLKLDRIKLSPLFKIVRGTNKKTEPQKPHPFIYQSVAEQLGTRSDLCIAIEDTSPGVIAAKEAGMRCIAVPNAYSMKQDFSRADIVLSDIRDSVKYIRSLN